MRGSSSSITGGRISNCTENLTHVEPAPYCDLKLYAAWSQLKGGIDVSVNTSWDA